MKIVENFNTYNLSESSQSLKVLFARCYKEEEDVIQTTQFVQCRDYLGDALWVQKYEKSAKIFGMEYSAEKKYFNKNCSEYLLQFDTTKLKNSFLKGIEYLHEIEAKNNIPKTEIVKLKNKLVYVCGDKLWNSNVFLVSLYSYLLKICTLNGDWSSLSRWAPELAYKARTRDKWEYIINSLQTLAEFTETTTGWKQEPTWGNLDMPHNCSGLVTLSQTRCVGNAISEWIYK